MPRKRTTLKNQEPLVLTNELKQPSNFAWLKKNIVIVPVVAAIIAGSFTSIKYVLNLTDTITANQETILKLEEKNTASESDIYDLKTRLAAAEATWTMAENLYRQLSETVRDHEYDLKDLSR